MLERKTRKVRGWGRISNARSGISQPRDGSEIAAILSTGEHLPRGGGMSFGDVALNDSRNLIETLSLAHSQRMLLNESTGSLFCSSGVTQEEILRKIAPQGWILPAIPGAQKITLGGSIAANGHGKNHYVRGSISEHIVSLRIMLASGEVVEASREKIPELFWATVGGLGLTGVILSVKLMLQKISSVYAMHEVKGFEDVNGMLDLIEQHKGSYEYLLGWVDGNFKPGKRWRGAVSVGSILPLDQVENPWSLPPRRTIKLPIPNPLPWGNMLAGRIVNRAISLKFRHGRVELVDLSRFLFPQDTIVNWNLAFGYRGFVDYQCCVPVDNEQEFFEEIHQFLNKHRIFCFLVAIKRFGSPEMQGPFTFAQNGFSIGLDIPMRSGVLSLLHLLDEIVVDYGGRINPVKDSRVSPAMLRRMYPSLHEWLEIKEKYDPEKIFSSDLSRRLELTSR